MNLDSLQPAFELDLSVPSLPPRSRLMHLSPKRLGTGRAESLLSYIIRLAYAHCVSPRWLVKTEFVAANPRLGGILTNSFFARDMGTINGLGRYAGMFSGIVEDLTGMEETRRMTLRTYVGFLPVPGQGLTRRQPHWCPECWREMIAKGQEPYSPLAWAFSLYRVCARHGRRMASRCPTCGKLQPFLPRVPDATICDHCQATLIEDRGQRQELADIPSETAALESWLSEAVEDMVAKLGTMEGPEVYWRTREWLRLAADAFAAGSVAQLCERISLQRDAIQPWLGKGVRPSLPMFLSVCYALDVMPSAMLLKSEVSGPMALRRLPGVITPRGVRPLLSEARREQLRELIEAVANDENDARPAVLVAKQFGLERSCFKYWFADLHERIAAKYAAASAVRSDQRHARHRDQMESVVDDMLAQGDFPARRRVDLALREQGVTLKAPTLRQDYRAYVSRLVLAEDEIGKTAS